jgi:phage gp36-like protein
MAYITQQNLLAAIQTDMLANGLNDTNAGVADAALFTEIYTAAENEIHGFLEARFHLPFASAPALVKNAALVFCAEAVFARRGISTDANPFAARAKALRERLAAVQKGEARLMLDAEGAEPKGDVIATDSNIYDSTPGRFPL